MLAQYNPDQDPVERAMESWGKILLCPIESVEGGVEIQGPGLRLFLRADGFFYEDSSGNRRLPQVAVVHRIPVIPDDLFLPDFILDQIAAHWVPERKSLPDRPEQIPLNFSAPGKISDVHSLIPSAPEVIRERFERLRAVVAQIPDAIRKKAWGKEGGFLYRCRLVQGFLYAPNFDTFFHEHPQLAMLWAYFLEGKINYQTNFKGSVQMDPLPPAIPIQDLLTQLGFPSVSETPCILGKISENQVYHVEIPALRHALYSRDCRRILYHFPGPVLPEMIKALSYGPCHPDLLKAYGEMVKEGKENEPLLAGLDSPRTLITEVPALLARFKGGLRQLRQERTLRGLSRVMEYLQTFGLDAYECFFPEHQLTDLGNIVIPEPFSAPKGWRAVNTLKDLSRTALQFRNCLKHYANLLFHGQLGVYIWLGEPEHVLVISHVRHLWVGKPDAELPDFWYLFALEKEWSREPTVDAQAAARDFCTQHQIAENRQHARRILCEALGKDPDHGEDPDLFG